MLYEDVTIFGFTFYTEQSDDSVLGYYRKDQLDEDGNHFEDKFWRENKRSGFASPKIGEIKKKIIRDLIKTNKIKMLNEEEINGLKI